MYISMYMSEKNFYHNVMYVHVRVQNEVYI